MSHLAFNMLHPVLYLLQDGISASFVSPSLVSMGVVLKPFLHLLQCVIAAIIRPSPKGRPLQECPSVCVCVVVVIV